MSAISPLFISDRITQPLREVSQRNWTLLAARGVLKTLVVGLTIVLAASLLLGFVERMPIPARIAIAVGAWGTVLWWTLRSLAPALRRWSLTHSALRADSLLGDSHERISSAVELSQAEDMYRGSPELVDHLIKQAEGDAQRVNAAAVVPYKPMMHWALAFLPVLGLWAFFTINSHTSTAVLRGLYSTLMPWLTPPAAWADIAVQPGDKTLDQGDPLTISVTVSAIDKKTSQATLIRQFSTGQSVSQSMAQTTGSQFSLALDPASVGFKYQVSTDRGSSPWYTITVNPRPSISQLDVRYDYPKYTALEQKNYLAADGSIDAVMGTQVTLTIHTSTPLVADKSLIVFDDGKPTRATAPITATAEPNVYTTTFPVSRTCDYQINLLNSYNLPNKDNDLHAIVAEIDQPPTISILTPKDKITVTPEDEVTITYHAADDYGIAKVEALVQVDDRPERVVPLTIRAADRRNFGDKWMFTIPEILKQDGVEKATTIEYQLRATDNRYPDAQIDLSARQMLRISKYEQRSFQEKVNEKRKTDLAAAIRKAIDRLNESRGQLFAPAEHPKFLREAHLSRATNDARDLLGKTGKDLSTAAEQFLDTPFAEVARAAKGVADGDIAQAAENTAKLLLDYSSDNDLAKADGKNAIDNIDSAREKLERLLQKADDAQKKAAAAEELKAAARKQAEAAKALAEHPEKKDENNQKQNDAINKLNEALANDPTLKDNDAKRLEAKAAELEKKIEAQQEKQTELQNQTAKQEEKQQAKDEANALAQEQKKLNEQVQQFAKDDKQPLEQAHAQVPDKNQQDNVVKQIENHDLQQAAQSAKQQAEQLKQDANQLKDQASNPDNNPSQDQQKQQQQDQQNKQDAQNAQNQANQAAQDLKNQTNQDQPNKDAQKSAAEQVAKAAEQIQKQADKVEQQNANGAKNADVQKAADAAKADAAQAQQDAQKAAAAQDPADARQAAEKAKDELAQAGQELAQAAQDAAQADKAAAQDQNQQAAAKAADQAKGLADQQQAIADKLNQQAQQAADAQAIPTKETAAQQQAAAEQAQQTKQQADALAEQAKDSPNPALAQRAAEAAQALDQAAAAQQKAAAAEADHKPADAAQAQADAQQALAKAQDALRGHPEEAQAKADQAAADAAQANADAAAKADPGQGPPDAGKPDAGQGQPEAGQGKPEAGQGKPEAGQGPPSPTAGQAAAEAAQAQQQAQQSNPAAAAEAAQALAQAAQAAAAALPGQGQPGEPGTEPGTEPGQDPGTNPGPTPDSKQGIQGQANGGKNGLPPAVAALGINPGEWAKLPPMMQKELMNAAQHSGPPAYKAMIKNYYIRVARAQSEQPQAPAEKQ